MGSDVNYLAPCAVCLAADWGHACVWFFVWVLCVGLCVQRPVCASLSGCGLCVCVCVGGREFNGFAWAGVFICQLLCVLCMYSEHGVPSKHYVSTKVHRSTRNPNPALGLLISITLIFLITYFPGLWYSLWPEGTIGPVHIKWVMSSMWLEALLLTSLEPYFTLTACSLSMYIQGVHSRQCARSLALMLPVGHVYSQERPAILPEGLPYTVRLEQLYTSYIERSQS